MSGTCDRRETPRTDGVCDARSGRAVFQIEIDEEPSSEQEQTINSRGVLKSWLVHSTRTDWTGVLKLEFWTLAFQKECSQRMHELNESGLTWIGRNKSTHTTPSLVTRASASILRSLLVGCCKTELSMGWVGSRFLSFWWVGLSPIFFTCSGLGWVSQLIGWVGSHKMDPRTTLL